MTSIQPSRREGGFTLLELLLVIGVAALLLIGGIATYRLVSDGNKATEATRLLLTLRQEAQVMAQQQGGTYTGIVYSTAVTDPNNVFVATGILRDQQNNPFNGPITINVNAADPALLDIAFDNVSRPGCVKLFTSITNPNEIDSVSVNGGAAQLANAVPSPLTAINAATQCTLAVNRIVWTLK
jgi:type II secretory pathway pseudopilin PulG